MVTKSRFSGGAHEYAAQFVREAIRAGRWTAGEAIDVTALAVELRISPSPVREALARLRGEGILGTRYRDGYSLVLLQAHELAEEYRFVGLTAQALATHLVRPVDVMRPHLERYVARVEAVLISLALASDLPTAALKFHQSALRMNSYIAAELQVISDAERNLSHIEELIGRG
ncbi:GntR family transcriptional regulator [Sphingomonas sp. UYP23]